MGAAAVAEVAALLVQGPGRDVERDSRGQDLGVVDLPDRFGVVEARRAQGHG
jgi:hypothetical protein